MTDVLPTFALFLPELIQNLTQLPTQSFIELQAERSQAMKQVQVLLPWVPRVAAWDSLYKAR